MVEHESDSGLKETPRDRTAVVPDNGDRPPPGAGLSALAVIGLLDSLARSGSSEARSAIEQALATVGRMSGFDRTRLVWRRKRSGGWRTSQAWAMPGHSPPAMDLPQPLPALWLSRFSRDEPVQIAATGDLPASRAAERHLLLDASIGAILAIPVLDGGAPAGFLSFETIDRPHSPSPDDLVLLRSVAIGIGALALRAETETALRDSRDQLNATLAAIPDMIVEVGADRLIRAVHASEFVPPVNPVEQQIGRSLDDVLPPETAALAEAMMADLDAGRTAEPRRYLLDTPRGPRWFEARVARWTSSGGGYVFVIRDISQEYEARNRLRDAVEALPDAFVIFDPDDRLLLCNARYRDLFPAAQDMIRTGMHYEDLLRHFVGTGMIPEARHNPEGWIRGRLQRHHAPFTDIEQLHADGQWYRVIERRMADGSSVGMRIDITQLKRAEERLTHIIQGAEAGTWEWNVTTGENLVNDRWAEMLGYTLADLMPMTINIWRRLVHPEDLARADALLEHVFAREIDQFEYELRLRHRFGHWITVLSRGRVVRWSSDGTPDMMSGVHLDITARKRAEQRLEEIIDAAEAGTWEFDYSFGQSNINERWAEMLGHTRAELAHRPGFGLRELVHPDDLVMLDELHQSAVFDGREVFATEMRMRHRDGHWVWVITRGRVIAWDAEGRPAKAAGIHIDITERKRLEAALVAERDYLALLMETSADCFIALDAEGRILYANRAAESVLGVPASQIEGRRYDDPRWQITLPDGSPLAREDLPVAEVLHRREPVRDLRIGIALPDGSRRVLSVNVAPVRGGTVPVRVVCAINDISAQAAAEDAMRTAADRAEAASRAKSAFLANMSHEIRTPLNGVLGMAEVLASTPLSQDQQEILRTIRDSGDALLTIINDILDLARIEAGKLALAPEPFVPTALARRIRALHSVSARAKGLSLIIETGPGAERVRMGDATRIGQILHNLIGNAIKFTETGSVTLRLADEAGRLSLSVSDTGIGMTEEQMGRVFNEFEQADNSVTRRFGGSGLGLAIVRKLVDVIGGTIRMESAPERGTRIEVLLETPAIASNEAGAHQARSAGLPGSLEGLRVLVAEDNRTNRKIIEIMLDRLGIVATFAEDGQQACDAWQPGVFDLLLLDVSMPVKDGIEALTEIEARARAAGSPRPCAIAATANVMADQIEGYRAKGFAAVLGKPFRQEELLQAFRDALRELS